MKQHINNSYFVPYTHTFRSLFVQINNLPYFLKLTITWICCIAAQTECCMNANSFYQYAFNGVLKGKSYHQHCYCLCIEISYRRHLQKGKFKVKGRRHWLIYKAIKQIWHKLLHYKKKSSINTEVLLYHTFTRSDELFSTDTANVIISAITGYCWGISTSRDLWHEKKLHC